MEMAEPCNLLDCVVEMCEFIQHAKTDQGMNKADLADSCEQKCLFMIRMAMLTPYTTSLSVSEWKVMEADMETQ